MIFSQTDGLLSGTMKGNSVEAVPPSLPLPSRSVFSPSNGFVNDRVQLRAFDKRQIQHLIRRTLDKFKIGDVELRPVSDPRGTLDASRDRFRAVLFDFRLDEAIAIHSVIEF